MNLNYQKKFFFKKCQNFNDFKLSKKNFSKKCQNFNDLKLLKKIFSKNVQNFNIFKIKLKKIFFSKLSKILNILISK
ncbi:MAG: hypothetical protein B6I24_08710 [Bacteroidetes bacterium 4572_128]|nr:MAG: hypothetical protein B6I24_08710 [Bacteroidetes bacterium 4572_128]